MNRLALLIVCAASLVAGRVESSCATASNTALFVVGTEREGRPVAGIKPGAFEVRIDGKPQPLISAGTVEQRTVLALIDTSGSMVKMRDWLNVGVRNTFRLLPPRDAVRVG